MYQLLSGRNSGILSFHKKHITINMINISYEFGLITQFVANGVIYYPELVTFTFPQIETSSRNENSLQVPRTRQRRRLVFTNPKRHHRAELSLFSYSVVCQNLALCCSLSLNSLTGKQVLARSSARALETHRFHCTYVRIVQKISRRGTSTILPS